MSRTSTRIALLAAAACLMITVQALDVPVKFCVEDCSGKRIGGKRVQLSGCTDIPYQCITAKSGKDYGCCSIATPPNVIKYCHASAKNYCQWSVITLAKHAGAPYVPNYATFYDAKGVPTTPWDMTLAVAPECDCKDKAKCPEFVTTAPLIKFKPSNCGKCPAPAPAPAVAAASP